MSAGATGIRGVVAAAMVLLLLALPPAASGQRLAPDALPEDRVGALSPAEELARQTPCTPRPRVGVEVTKTGEKDFQVVITAGRGNLELIRFGNAPNAVVSLPGRPAKTAAPAEIKPTAGPTYTFGLHATELGLAVTMPLEIYDGCGPSQPWRTFVGGGETATRVQIAIADASITEGDSGTQPLSFTVTLTSPASAPVTVQYATANGTATAPADYTATSGTLTFAPGETTKQIAVPVVGDAIAEPSNETFTVQLSNPTNATIADATATGTIVDNEGAPSLAIADATTVEGNSGSQPLQFSVSLSSPSSLPVTVAYATSNDTATAPADYEAASGTLSFAPGETSKVISVTVKGDTVAEGTERFFVRLSNATNAGISREQASGTITDDDPTPTVTLSLTGSPFAENGGVATVTATLSNPSSQQVTVDLDFGGSAARGPGGDYLASDTHIVIAALATSGTMTLTGVPDGVFEGDETVEVVIVGVTNAVEATPQSVAATITEDDVSPTVTLSVTGSPIAENLGTATVTATLSGPVGQLVTVTLGFGGTATLTAGPTADYTASASQIEIPALSTSGSITLTAIDDATIEGDETIVVSITAVSGGATEQGNQEVTAIISDDDAPPVVTTTGTTTPFVENAGAVIVDSGVTVTDADSTTLASATIVITNVQDGAAETLDADLTGLGGITKTTSSGAGTFTLTLTGPGLRTDFQTALQRVTYNNTATNVTAVPSRTISFQVNDGNNPSNVATKTVSVTAANDAPSGTDETVTTTEDTPYVFAVADFGFTDPNDTPPNALQAVVITTLPSAGTLTNNGNPVTAGAAIPAANITGGLLVFTPAANGNGSPYTTFTFQVQDDGGTANGGQDTDPTPNTITVNVTPVNDAPAGTDTTVSTTEDTPYVFAAADFGFTDPNDTPPNALQAVVITTLPSAGTLTNNGTPVTAGATIPVANITGGLLVFTPALSGTGVPYATFTFQVQDNGGTANGGVDLDQTPNTMSINVNVVNDAPSGTDNTVTTGEDVPYVFAAADFGFTDPNDTPPNALAGVVITTLPGQGTLTNNGTPVTAGASVPVANISGGLLVFTPAAGTSGTPYTTFTFQVQDDGGTANGGVDTDPTPNTMTVNVTGRNDAPQGTDNTVTTLEETPYTFTVADFGYSDPNDTPPDLLQAVVITTLPSAGTLTNNGTPVTAGAAISAANITSGLLVFTPAPNGSGTPYTTFTFQVQDDGGTANGGVDTDPTPNTVTVTVTPVNDAPAGTDDTVTVLEDVPYAFTTADFGFTDPNDSPADALLAVVITTTPGAGTLTNNGTPVTAGAAIPAANITGGLMVFTPAANANGSGYASFTFQVQDDGGTANGGMDTDPTPNTITIDVTPVNDAPSGADDSATIDEDSTYTFTIADFPLTDPNDTPANTLAAVVITTTPTAGTLRNNGVALSAGQSVPVAAITGNQFTYTPAPNGNGTPYATFTFQVQDNGGTANGGVDTDQSANTFTFNVTPINDPPVVTPPAAYAAQSNMTLNFPNGATDLFDGSTITDTADGPGAEPFSITAETVTSTQSAANPNNVTINADGSFTYEPPPGFTGADTFTFEICDSGVPGSACTDATATVNVAGPVIWFVDDNAGAGGKGTLASPFQTLAQVAAVDTSNQRVFVYSGSYAGFTLNASEWLIGQGVTGTTFDAIFGITPPTGTIARPTINGARPALSSTVTMATSSVVRGLNISSGGATGITGSGATSLTTGEVSVTTTTGTAVSFTGATSSALSFTSVSANGAASGIVLNNHSGSFTVTGSSSGLCGGQVTVNAVGTPATVTTPNTADCTGGTIQATTGAGISISGAQNVSLTRMRILNSGTDGIHVLNVNGFSLSHSYISDGSGGAQDRGIEMGDFSTGTPVSGTIAITNSTIGPTPHDNFGVGISSGTSTWNITGSVFTDSQQNSGFNFELRNATVSSFTIDGSVFSSQFADGMQMQPGSNVVGNITSAVIQNSTFTGNNIAMDLNHDGTGAVAYSVINNTFRNSASHAINLFTSAVQAPATSGTLNASFINNRIGASGVSRSGSSIGNGLRVNINGGADATVLIDDNIIRETPNGRGIEVISRNGTGGLDVTLTDNQVNNDFVPTTENSGFSLASIILQSNCVTVCNTLRADIRANTVPATPPNGDLLAAQLALVETGASTLQLVDSPPASANCTNQLTDSNTGSASANAGCAVIAGPIDTP